MDNDVASSATGPEPPFGFHTGERGAPGTAQLRQWALDQLPLPMALFDHQGLAVAVNSAMERAMGKPERDLLGLRMGESAPGRRIAGLDDIDEAVERVLRTGETVPYEAFIRAPGASGPG